MFRGSIGTIWISMDRKSTVLGMENRKATVMLNGKAIREDNWNMYALMYLDLVVSWCDIMAYHGTVVRYMSGIGIMTVLHVKPETIGLSGPYLTWKPTIIPQ